MSRFDVAVIGAGAAGMMCAAVAGQRGRSVVLIDHAHRPAEKIRISGGGRCNFTNTGTQAANFLSADPEFCRPALAAYGPRAFVGLVRQHRIAFHEKHRGQLFCDGSSEAIIAMLRAECASGKVVSRAPCRVESISTSGADYSVVTDAGLLRASKLVVATGGLSIPKLGASDLGYRIARQFGLGVVEPRPGLVPLTFSPQSWAGFVALAGLSLPVSIQTRPAPQAGATRAAFDEDLLFTHRGLSGPAVLQISSYWEPGQPLSINLVPQLDLARSLRESKDQSRQDLGNVLGQWLPKRLSQGWLASQIPGGSEIANRKIAEIPNRALDQLAASLACWDIVPSGTEGFRKAEVTRGGVDTRDLNAGTLEARRQPGLYFVGEVVDVTGWLGGYNFQWAWSSGVLAGRAV